MTRPSLRGSMARCGAVLVFCRLSLVPSAQTPPDEILLKDYKPRSIFKIPETRVEKARYPVVDVHSHDYTPTNADVDRWVRTMDEVGIEKTVILSGSVRTRFDAAMAKYGKHPTRFAVWCGIDYTGFNQPGYGPAAVAELERCHKAGATGVGELSDKGRGLGATTNTLGMHIDDPRMDSILAKCAELRMPVNIHVGEDKWMYEPMDQTNDGLKNAWKWRVPNAPGVLQHDEVVDTLERAVKKHPRTIFIACHLANCCSDLNRLGAIFEKYPNLYADIGARYAELSPIPRFVSQFFERYQDRLLYGTDMNPQPEMYRVTFRLLETADEHFYPPYFSHYHWPLHAWALSDEVLKKIYRENALKLLSAEGTVKESEKRRSEWESAVSDVLAQQGFAPPTVLEGTNSVKWFISDRPTSQIGLHRVLIRLDGEGGVTARITGYQVVGASWAILGRLFMDKYRSEEGEIEKAVRRKLTGPSR